MLAIDGRQMEAEVWATGEIVSRLRERIEGGGQELVERRRAARATTGLTLGVGHAAVARRRRGLVVLGQDDPGSV